MDVLNYQRATLTVHQLTYFCTEVGLIGIAAIDMGACIVIGHGPITGGECMRRAVWLGQEKRTGVQA
jgi:hypothetical protein